MLVSSGLVITMADLTPPDEKKDLKYGDVKDVYDVESSPVYDESGPVEFQEKKELR